MSEGAAVEPSVLKMLAHRYGVALKHAQYRRFWVSATVAGAGVWGLIVARKNRWTYRTERVYASGRELRSVTVHSTAGALGRL